MEAEETFSPGNAPESPPASHTLRHRLLASCAYLGPGFLIPLFSREDSRFLRWHTQQGFVLFFFEALAIAGVVVLDHTVGRIPLLGLVVILLFEFVAFGAALVLSILGVVKSFAGELFRLPILADYADRIPGS